MRVVVDTNVIVGACIGRGAFSKVIEAVVHGRLSPYIGPSLLFEYRDVIARPEPFRHARLGLRGKSVTASGVRVMLYLAGHLFQLAAKSPR